MSVRDAGRKGGRATRARLRPEFFAQIGQKGGKAVSQRYPSEHFQEIGRKGAAAWPSSSSGPSGSEEAP